MIMMNRLLGRMFRVCAGSVCVPRRARGHVHVIHGARGDTQRHSLSAPSGV